MGKRRFRASRAFKIPLATVAGLTVSLSVPTWGIGDSVLSSLQKGDFKLALECLGGNFTGFLGGEWKWERIVRGLGPIVVGALISKFVGGKPLNLNRYIKIPFIKL